MTGTPKPKPKPGANCRREVCEKGEGGETKERGVDSLEAFVQWGGGRRSCSV